MTQEELDKLAEKYQDDNTIIRYYGPGNGTVQEYNKTMAEVFKDGWNACKEQILKDGNVILTEEDFDAEKEKSMEWGYNLCKEQMLKEAVEGKVFMSFAPGHNQMVMADVDLPTNTKVRIIIVKEDEK